MAKISILIASLPYLLCAMDVVNRQPSPCSEYFTYMTKPGITDMLGQIEIPSPSENNTFFLKVALDTTTELPICETILNVLKYPQKEVGPTVPSRFEVDDLKNSQLVRLELAQSIKASVGRVRQGRPLLYHVYYPTHERIPSLSAIWFNNRRYCPSPEVSGNITANVELGHILYAPNEEPLVYNDGPWQQITQPWHRNSSIYRIDNPSYDRLNNDECGITSYYTDDTNRLISDFDKTLPGQWPWLVAIHLVYPNGNSPFWTSGSILTTRHIITGGSYSLITQTHRHNLYVSFGQLNSNKWQENHSGVIIRSIADIKNKGYLTILILKTAIEYNAFIMPICLWSGSTDLQDIVHMTGYIVGWGFGDFENRPNTSVLTDYSERYIGEPRMVKVPIINISVRVIFESMRILQFVSNNITSYTPCDAGGGLVVFNITTGRYQLRGVAYDCLPGNMVFVDVADHLSWIRDQISIT